MKSAKAYAVAFEIMCPEANGGKCQRSGEPIPAHDGSFIWRGGLPDEVTCPDCGRTFKVSRRINLD